MSRATVAAGLRISKALRPSEDAIGGALIQNAQLMAAIIEGRIQSGLAAEVGHDAVLSISATMTALTQALDHAIRGHQQLTEVRDRLGFDSISFGCTVGKPSERPEPSGRTRFDPLRAVA